MGKLHTSMRGREVDMDKLNLKFENVPAVGNAKVNARGDIVDDMNRVISAKNNQVNKQYNKQTTKK